MSAMREVWKSIDFCASNGLTVANSMFPHHSRQKSEELTPELLYFFLHSKIQGVPKMTQLVFVKVSSNLHQI